MISENRIIKKTIPFILVANTFFSIKFSCGFVTDDTLSRCRHHVSIITCTLAINELGGVTIAWDTFGNEIINQWESIITEAFESSEEIIGSICLAVTEIFNFKSDRCKKSWEFLGRVTIIITG